LIPPPAFLLIPPPAFLASFSNFSRLLLIFFNHPGVMGAPRRLGGGAVPSLRGRCLSWLGFSPGQTRF
jgi:hypothetical protein